MIRAILFLLALLPAFAQAGDYPVNKTGSYVGNGQDWSRTAKATTSYYEVPTKGTMGSLSGSEIPYTKTIDITPPKQYPHYPSGTIIEAVKIPAPSVGKNFGKFAKNFGRMAKANVYGMIAGFALEWAAEKGWQWVESDFSQWKDKNFPEGSWQQSVPTPGTTQKMQDACWKGWGKDWPGYWYNKVGPVLRFTPSSITFQCSMYFNSTDLGFVSGPYDCGHTYSCTPTIGTPSMSRYDAEWELRPVSDSDFTTAAQQYGDANTQKLADAFNNAGWDWTLPDNTKIMVMGDTSTDRQPISSTTTRNPDGSTTTTNTYQTTIYNYNGESAPGLTVSPTSVRTITETEVNGEVTSTTTSDAPTQKPGGTMPSEGSDSESKPVEIPDFCKEYPNRLGCIDAGELPETREIPTQEVSTNFDWSAFSMPSYCPAPKSVNIFNRVYQISYQPICDLVTGVRPVLLALAFVIAGFIVFGALRNG